MGEAEQEAEQSGRYRKRAASLHRLPLTLTLSCQPEFLPRCPFEQSQRLSAWSRPGFPKAKAEAVQTLAARCRERNKEAAQPAREGRKPLAAAREETGAGRQWWGRQSRSRTTALAPPSPTPWLRRVGAVKAPGRKESLTEKTSHEHISCTTFLSFGLDTWFVCPGPAGLHDQGALTASPGLQCREGC